MAIDFNGTTSKIQNDTADVLNSSKTVTVCCSFFADSRGENTEGMLLAMSEVLESTASFQIAHSTENRIRILKGFGWGYGLWSFPAVDLAWHNLAVSYDFNLTSSNPIARVDLEPVIVTRDRSAFGFATNPPTGYCIGNVSANTLTWDGRITALCIHNVILTSVEMDQQCTNPGSVTRGLRLYLPMTGASDINDLSGNGFNGIGTSLASAPGPPPPPSGQSVAEKADELGEVAKEKTDIMSAKG